MPRKKSEAVEAEEKQNIQYTSEKRRLFHKFTEEDENILHEKVTELTRKKEKFAEEAKLHASIAKGAECEIQKTIAALDEGGEEREMECPVTVNFTEGVRIVKHPETEEIIETRELKPEERQQPLFEEEKGANEVMDEAVGGTSDDNE